MNIRTAIRAARSADIPTGIISLRKDFGFLGDVPPFTSDRLWAFTRGSFLFPHRMVLVQWRPDVVFVGVPRGWAQSKIPEYDRNLGQLLEVSVAPHRFAMAFSPRSLSENVWPDFISMLLSADGQIVERDSHYNQSLENMIRQFENGNY